MELSWQGKLIIFTDEFLDRISSTMKAPIFYPNHILTSYSSRFSLTDKVKETCDALLLEIVQEHQLVDPSLTFLNLLFSALLTKLNTARPNISDNYLSESRRKIFSQFMVLLENNYTSLRDATIYAELLNITYKTLNKICKLATNQTTKQLIDAYIILEAKRKLTIEDIRIQQLADELGFDEATNFIKYFKKHTLLTPTLEVMAENGIKMVYTTNHKVLGEGNFVLSISEGSFAGKATSFYDLFRVENGKIVEHWDVMESIIPKEQWKNANGKFGNL